MLETSHPCWDPKATGLSKSFFRERGRILYITFDGVLEPLGRSQVLNYILGLSRVGFRFTLISLERATNLQSEALTLACETELSTHGVRWLRYPFASRSLRGVLKNCYVTLSAAYNVVREEKTSFIHGRSYVPAFIGWLLKNFTGTPYIFDMRGYWIDELADEGRWFKSRVAYQVGKRIERLLLKNALAIVTLTELQGADLKNGLLKNYADTPIRTITTCADYVEFAPVGLSQRQIPSEYQQRFSGKLIIGLVGSINASYYVDESFEFFDLVRKSRPDAHLLCITRQVSDMRALLQKRRLPEDTYTIVSVNHQEMPAWLRQINWGLLLLKARFSKRGSMPTKLSEFFSSGVRPIQYGCNEEVSRMVREAGSGIVLDSLSHSDLEKAASLVAATTLSTDEILRARETTRPYFGLEAGLAKYAELFDRLLLEKNS